MGGVGLYCPGKIEPLEHCHEEKLGSGSGLKVLRRRGRKKNKIYGFKGRIKKQGQTGASKRAGAGLYIEGRKVGKGKRSGHLNPKERENGGGLQMRSGIGNSFKEGQGKDNRRKRENELFY